MLAAAAPLFSFPWLCGADCCRPVFIEDGSTDHGKEGRRTDSRRPAVIAPLPFFPWGIGWNRVVCAFVALSASVDSHSVRLDGEEEEVAGFSVVSLFFVVVSFLFFGRKVLRSLLSCPLQAREQCSVFGRVVFSCRFVRNVRLHSCAFIFAVGLCSVRVLVLSFFLEWMCSKLDWPTTRLLRSVVKIVLLVSAGMKYASKEVLQLQVGL